jgi:hypothetical protein
MYCVRYRSRGIKLRINRDVPMGLSTAHFLWADLQINFHRSPIDPLIRGNSACAIARNSSAVSGKRGRTVTALPLVLLRFAESVRPHQHMTALLALIASSRAHPRQSRLKIAPIEERFQAMIRPGQVNHGKQQRPTIWMG